MNTIKQSAGNGKVIDITSEALRNALEKALADTAEVLRLREFYEMTLENFEEETGTAYINELVRGYVITSNYLAIRSIPNELREVIDKYRRDFADMITRLFIYHGGHIDLDCRYDTDGETWTRYEDNREGSTW